MRVRDVLRAERNAEKILEEKRRNWPEPEEPKPDEPFPHRQVVVRLPEQERPKDSYVIVMEAPRAEAPPPAVSVKRGRGGKRGRRRRRRTVQS